MARRNGKRRKLAAETLEARRCLAASLGWDGPGQGAAELTYFVGESPANVRQSDFESAIETALAAWSDVIDVEFTETDRPNQRDSIDFQTRPIDGPGGTLAQAYLPDDVNPARIAGDVDFDSAESWELGNGQGNRAFDLVRVAVHEIGHALGIDHLDISGAILAPFVSPSQQFISLTTADINAALELYAPAANDPAIDDPVTDGESEVVSNDLETTGSVPSAENDSGQADTPAVETENPFDSDRFTRNRFWRWAWFFWRARRNAVREGLQAAPDNHNATLPADVNQDGKVSPSDALTIINRLGEPLPIDSEMLCDVNADGVLTPGDALFVINRMGEGSSGAKTAEEEASDSDDEVIIDNGPVDADDAAQNEADENDGLDSLDDDQSAGGDSEDDDPLLPDEEDESEDGSDPSKSGEEDEFDDDSDSELSGDDDDELDDDESGDEADDAVEEDDLDDDSDSEMSGDEDDELESELDDDCHHGERILDRLFAFLDQDGDDLLTDSEIPAALMDRIASIDVNEDGAISREEVDALMAERLARPSRFDRLDDNGDGIVTIDEVNEQIWARISPADTSGDGGVSEEELVAYRESLPPRAFRRFDDNADGLITEDEVNAAIWERLAESDDNADGAIDPDEFPDVRPQRGSRFGHGRFRSRLWR